MKTAAIILAAGQASRFGSPKQLLEIQGQTLIQRTAALAHRAGCHPVIIITGAYHKEISQLHFPKQITLLQNPAWAEGMGCSLAHGVSALTISDPEATLILLADQPAITTETLNNLQTRLTPPKTTIVISDNGKSKGPPSLFHKTHFPALRNLSGDQGAKELIKQKPQSTKTIQAPEAAWDIDHPEAWLAFNAE